MKCNDIQTDCENDLKANDVNDAVDIANIINVVKKTTIIIV